MAFSPSAIPKFVRREGWLPVLGAHVVPRLPVDYSATRKFTGWRFAGKPAPRVDQSADVPSRSRRTYRFRNKDPRAMPSKGGKEGEKNGAKQSGGSGMGGGAGGAGLGGGFGHDEKTDHHE